MSLRDHALPRSSGRALHDEVSAELAEDEAISRPTNDKINS
jgi:hypothetical protein